MSDLRQEISTESSNEPHANPLRIEFLEHSSRKPAAVKNDVTGASSRSNLRVVGGTLDLSGDIYGHAKSSSAGACADQATAVPYEQKEAERARSYQEDWSRKSDVAKAGLIWSKLPGEITLRKGNNDRTIEFSSDKFAAMLEGVPGIKLEKPAREFLDGMKKISLVDNKLKLDGIASLSIPGGLKVDLANPSLDIIPDQSDPTKFHLRNIKGISCAGGLIKMSEAELTLKKGESGTTIELAVKNPIDKNLRPLFKSLKLPQEDYIKLDGIPVNNSEAIEPVVAQLRQPPGNRDLVKMAEEVAGAESLLRGAKLDDVKYLFEGVQSIQKKGDVITIERAGKTERDLGGMSLDADKTISFRVKQDGSTLAIADIEGVTLTLKPEMPEAVKKYLGLDIGHIPVGIKNIAITDLGEGKQKVVMTGNNFLSKVGVFLKDGQPMIDADGRWKLLALVQCPPTVEERRQNKPLREMGIILPFNKDNNVDLTAQETADLVAQVAYQNIDRRDPRTYGLGIVAVGSHITSRAIEEKNNFNRGLKVIGGWLGL